MPLILDRHKEGAHFQACIGKAMPPTLEAFKEDIKRAHFHKAIPPTLET